MSEADAFASDLAEAGDEQTRIDDAFNGNDPKVANEIADQYKTQLESSAKLAKPDSPPSVETSLVSNKIEIKINGDPIEVQGADGKTYQFGESITEPNVDPKDTVSSLENGLNKAGVELTPDMKSKIEENINSNPKRKANIDSDNLKKNGDSIIQTDPELKNTIDTVDPNNSESIQKADDALKNSDVQKKLNDLQDKLNKMSDADKKSWIDKLKDNMMTVGKLALLALGGYLTYEFLQKHAQSMSGCWEYQNNGGSVSKCKVSLLTCNSDDANNMTGSSTDCQGMPTGCNQVQQSDPGYPDYQNCLSCTGNNSGQCCSKTVSNGECSNFCSCSYLMCNSAGSRIAYQCVKAGPFDALSDIFGGITGLLDQITTSSTDFLTNFFKYLKWIFIIVGVIILLVLAWKLFRGSQQYYSKPVVVNLEQPSVSASS